MTQHISLSDFRAMQPKKMSEDQLQASCINWFKSAHAKLWTDKRLFSIPNAAKRGKVLAMVMKRTGMVSGVSDLLLTVPRGDYSGLFIEMKVGNNSLTEEQEKFIKAHEKDYCCQVCWTLDEFIKAVTDYLNINP